MSDPETGCSARKSRFMLVLNSIFGAKLCLRQLFCALYGMTDALATHMAVRMAQERKENTNRARIAVACNWALCWDDRRTRGNIAIQQPHSFQP